MNTPKVSVIIPVYNVEKYIERCVRTLFAQTLDDLEFIFVDDCSPDKSMAVMQRVLEEYPHRKPQVKLIRNENNIGVGQSRQKGIDAAAGEYLIHCDPDDWVELDMYEQMYKKACEEDADMVICDYFTETSEGQIIESQYIPDDNAQLLLRISHIKLHVFLWNRLISRELIRSINIRIPQGVDLWEDMAYCIPTMLSSLNRRHLSKPLYHYFQHRNSIIHKFDIKKANSKLKAVQSIEDFVKFSIPQGIENYKNSLSALRLRATLDYLNKELFNPEIWRKESKATIRIILSQNFSVLLKVLMTLLLFHFDGLAKILSSKRNSLS